MTRLTYRFPAWTCSSQYSTSLGSSDWMPAVSPYSGAFCRRTASSRVSAFITPRMGPKYSVRWYSEPGRTPARSPGDQSAPVESSSRGRSTQFSPGPRVVSPRCSFASSGRTTGPICEDGSDGQATCRDRTASTSWSWNRRDVAIDPTTITTEPAEHFCPACPNAEYATSLTARSGSADGVTMIEFFPLVSASSGSSGRQERNNLAVSYEPVRITRSTRGCETRCRPTARSGVCTSRSSSRGTPAAHIASARRAPDLRAGVAGLKTTPLPAASAATTPPVGMARGKFQGGVTRVTRDGTNRAPSTCSSSRARSAYQWQKSMASETSGSPWSRVLPASAAATSSNSPRRSASSTPTRWMISARSAAGRAPHSAPASATPAMMASISSALPTTTASASAIPSSDPGTRSTISRAHARLPGSTGSVSGVFRNVHPPSSSWTTAAISSAVSWRRSWVRIGVGTGSSASRASRAARNRSASCSKTERSRAMSKTPDMKFSGAEFSSSRRTR